MCGIIGYTGVRPAAPLLLEGLGRLAYRGYDSAGIAVLADGGRIVRCRAEGKLARLLEKCQGGAEIPGTAGIGHTRWATHGAPLEHNAHPHLDGSGRVAVVHNGIIENWRELRRELAEEGYTFSSETDTEVIVHLLARAVAAGRTPAEALRDTVGRLRGTYALGVIFACEPEVLYGVRRESPLLVGRGDGEMFLASDIPAILPYTRLVWEPPTDTIVRLTPRGVTLPFPGDAPAFREVTWDAAAAERGGYASFMEKEIHEIPQVVAHTATEGEALLPPSLAGNVTGVTFIGCGSAYHVGLAGAYFGEKLTGVPVRVFVASEFRYHPVPLAPRELVVAVSQSGETADTLAALREAKRRGAYVLSVVNVVGSTIARESDRVFYTQAGPEIAVATTKAFCAQLVAVYRLFAEIATAKRGRAVGAEVLSGLAKVPDAVRRVLDGREGIRRMAHRIAQAESAFFIGRGADYPACLEGSLKLKEISYLHAEAYPAGELKHGTISLVTAGVPVIALATQSALVGKTLSGVEEVHARGAEVYLITDETLTADAPTAARFVLPHIHEMLMPLPAAVAFELLALEVAAERGLDPDMPRNLAKSVTVE